MNFELTKEQRFLQNAVKDLTKNRVESKAAEIDKVGTIPDDIIERMVSIQIPGMCVPEKFGGLDAQLLDTALVIEQLSYSGCGVWWYAAFSNSIPHIVNDYGSPVQKQSLLPGVCDGLSIPSIQFTEEATGSDPSRLQTAAVKQNNGYLINGSKRFSTFGRRPGFAVVFASDDKQQCTAFIVDKETEGYSFGENYELMGSGGVEAVDIYLDGIRVPEGDILGKKGEGFELLLKWIAIEKIQQCAACVGIAQAALDEAVLFARSRPVRGKTQADLQSTQSLISEMYASLQAARLLTYRVASIKETTKKNWEMEASAAKIFVVPATMKIVEHSRRIHGAYGYTKDSKIERLYRAIAGASAIAVSLEINKSMVGKSLLK